jgi:hypothetical protein
MFSQSLIDALVEAADKAGIERACLLGIAEIEAAGSPFESDGRTPTLLYERHIAWRQAAKVSRMLQSVFAAAGLAIPKWSKATQYKDQGTSAKRLSLIARARAVNEEVANQSASWGIGQTMGFLYPELGFASANAMVDRMTGSVAGQIECFVAELKNKHLIAPLNAHQWAVVARGYNGSGYAANHYDTRLADAWKRWTRKIAAGPAAMALAPDDMTHEEIKALQTKLRALGYSSIGRPDGDWGTKTIGALNQFQAHEGLPQTGKYDAPTREAMKTAEPITQPRARADATAADLRDEGSKTIKTADAGGLFGWVKGTVGTVFVGGGAAEKLGLLDTAQAGIDKANQAKGIWESACDLAHPLFAGPAPIVIGLVLIVAGVATWFLFRTIKAHRVADHNSGVHAGPGG